MYGNFKINLEDKPLKLSLFYSMESREVQHEVEVTNV